MRIARTVERPAALGPEDAEEPGEGRSKSGQQTAGERTPRQAEAAMCGCGRRLRMAPSVLAAGPVLCGLCGHEFQAGRQSSKTTNRKPRSSG